MDVDITLGYQIINNGKERIQDFKLKLDDAVDEYSKYELLTPHADYINTNSVIFAKKGGNLLSELLDDIFTGYFNPTTEEQQEKQEASWEKKRVPTPHNRL